MNEQSTSVLLSINMRLWNKQNILELCGVSRHNVTSERKKVKKYIETDIAMIRCQITMI